MLALALLRIEIFFLPSLLLDKILTKTKYSNNLADSNNVNSQKNPPKNPPEIFSQKTLPINFSQKSPPEKGIKKGQILPTSFIDLFVGQIQFKHFYLTLPKDTKERVNRYAKKTK